MCDLVYVWYYVIKKKNVVPTNFCVFTEFPEVEIRRDKAPFDDYDHLATTYYVLCSRQSTQKRNYCQWRIEVGRRFGKSQNRRHNHEKGTDNIHGEWCLSWST